MAITNKSLQYINGRFFCHVLVQIFCGLLPKFWFAIANGLVWLVFIVTLTRMAGYSRTNRLAITTSTAALFWLAGWHFQFDPPIQINYVWMGAMAFLWIYLFFRNTKTNHWWRVPLWIIFSFLAGEGQESFSIPIGGAIILWFIVCRGRLNKWQWFGALAFGAGGLVLCLAPGNFVRLETPDLVLSSIMAFTNYAAKSLLLSMIIPLIAIIIFIFNRSFRKRLCHPDNICLFLFFTIIISLLLCIFLCFRGGERMLYVDVVALIVIILRNIKSKSKSLTVATIIGTILLPITITATCAKVHSQAIKYNMVENLYIASNSGIVVIPDSIYAIDDTGGKLMYAYSLALIERGKNPSKPWLKIYPVTLTQLDFKADTNLCVPFMKQGWIMIQSKNKPADFILEQTIIPQIINKHVGHRAIDFSLDSDILVDTTQNTSIAIYINHIPTWFRNCEVSIRDTSK